LSLTKKQIDSGDEVCPDCGTRVGDFATTSAADTQMVNIQDMARMAQEGIDVAASGEWDTSKTQKRRSKKTGE
jgi:hypothetical protein